MKKYLTIVMLLISIGSFASNEIQKVEKVKKVKVVKTQASEYRECINVRNLTKFRAQYYITKPSKRLYVV
jgi:hypothetical protein